MAYKYKSLDNRRKAKRNLERLLKKLDETPMDFPHMEMAANSGPAKSMSQYFRLEYVVGVHIYCEDGRRWYSDIEFRVPEGIPKLIGVPVKMPCATVEQAENFALSLIGQMKANPAKPNLDADYRSFIIDEFQFEIPADLFNEMNAAQAMIFDGPDNGYAFVTGRLEEVRASFGGRVTKGALEGISEARRLELAAVCSMALTVGLNRWPPNVFDESTDEIEGPFIPKGTIEETTITTMRINPRPPKGPIH
ncbi:hypothetical protein [Rhizobium leguminosarum]|uniref:hypothetical protein n=1 Tax=Rhizobium leguminosarum TaxID=384 RepID=UPI002E1686D5|nr:hypothetical protein U8Q02_38455 [Rhizobium leguminosarum]